MFTNSLVLNSHLGNQESQGSWRDLYLALRALATKLVYSFRVPTWQGQEADIIEDIVQETLRRITERSQKAERGEATPIHSLHHMMMVVAHNYCRDLRRHDRRLSRALLPDYSLKVPVRMNEEDHLLESVTENVYQESLFVLVAHEIANFPEKQRRALLIDLANRMCFDTQPTPLQKAFLEVGIQLQQYRQPIPTNDRERSRHLSLLSCAYKRIAHLPSVQRYIAVT